MDVQKEIAEVTTVHSDLTDKLMDGGTDGRTQPLIEMLSRI